MTLRALLLLFTSVLMVLVVLAAISVSFNHFRDYVLEQQRGHAQDGATALGLSLSNAIDGRDPVASASIVDAVFDSGRYLSVSYRDTEGAVIASRKASLSDMNVPKWFVSMVELPRSVGEAEVVRGWSRLGTVEVVSHPGRAYEDLWGTTLQMGGGMLVVALLGLFLLFWILVRALKPLRAVEAQARAMGRRDFRQRVNIRSTRELNQVTRALNQMAEDLSRLFEGQAKLIQFLRKSNNEDELTGLASRSAFERRLKVEVETEEKAAPGLLMLIQFAGFTQFNEQYGREEADELLVALAEILADFAAEHGDAFVGRRSGAEMAVFLPGVSRADGLIWGQALIEKLSGVYAQRSGDEPWAKVHAGIAEAEESHQVRDLWAAADEALRQAQAEPGSACHLSDLGRVDHRNGEEWRTLIHDAVSQNRLALWMQPVQKPDSTTPLFYQVFSRIEWSGGDIHAGIFVPVAERLGLIPDIDRQVVTKAIEFLQRRTGDRLSMTLGKSSVADSAFRGQVVAMLESAGQLRERLFMAISEHTLKVHRAEVIELVSELNRLRVPVMVDRFGVGGVPFSYLRNLRFQALRIEHSFVHDIDSHVDNRFFIESVMSIAHSTGVKVFATGVETAAEYDVLSRIGVDGMMGYHLARPFKVSE